LYHRTFLAYGSHIILVFQVLNIFAKFRLGVTPYRGVEY